MNSRSHQVRIEQTILTVVLAGFSGCRQREEILETKGNL